MKKICKVCKEEFETNHPLTLTCSDECRKIAHNEYMNNYIKKRYKEDPNFKEKARTRDTNYKIENYEKLSKYGREYRKIWRQNHKLSTEDAKLYQRKSRWAVLSYYSGGGIPKCACCGETRYEFLAINHKENNPDKRTVKEKRISGLRIITWLINHNLPEGFNVLCHNCNCSDGFSGFCPHKNPEKSFKPPEGYKYVITIKGNYLHSNIKKCKNSKVELVKIV